MEKLNEEQFHKVLNGLKKSLNQVNYVGDLGDIGNEIGIVVADYFSNNLGYEKEDFFSGLKHGISLTDGTH